MSRVSSNVLNIGKDIKTMTAQFKMKKMGPPKPTPASLPQHRIPTPAPHPYPSTSSLPQHRIPTPAPHPYPSTESLPQHRIPTPAPHPYPSTVSLNTNQEKRPSRCNAGLFHTSSKYIFISFAANSKLATIHEIFID